MVNWVVHKLIHLSNPKHRSWQTHSVLVTGGFLFLLYAMVSAGNLLFHTMGLSHTDWIILRMLVYGLILGVSSHLVADLLNPQGIHLIPGYKVRLVPKTHFFCNRRKLGDKNFLSFMCWGKHIRHNKYLIKFLRCRFN